MEQVDSYAEIFDRWLRQHDAEVAADRDRLAETVARVEELAAKDYPPPPPDERGAAGWRFAMEHVRAALDEEPTP